MKKVAKFEKVSYSIFKDAIIKNNIYQESDELIIKKMYDDIILPKRATTGSAGYDFFMPFACSLSKHETVIIPTGIRVNIQEGYFLSIVPRSGLGFKYRLQLDNTIGIIDSDYYFSDNEGHIMAKLTNDSINSTSCLLKKGSAFSQGIFLEYGITFDDDASDIRNGGFGSTNK